MFIQFRLSKFDTLGKISLRIRTKELPLDIINFIFRIHRRRHFIYLL